MLYNLGVGATEKELKYTFEGDQEFQVSQALLFTQGMLFPIFVAGHSNFWCDSLLWIGGHEL